MRSTNYVKVEGCAFHESRQEFFLHRQEIEAWVRVTDITEICPVSGTKRLWGEITEEEYKAANPQSSSEEYSTDGGRYLKRVPTTRVHMEFQDRNGDAHGFLVRETPEAFKARVDAIEFPPAPEEPEGPSLTDRGVWQPGESYAQFDLVQDPDDVSKRLIALQASTSTSKLVLSNKEFWGALAG